MCIALQFPPSESMVSRVSTPVLTIKDDEFDLSGFKGSLVLDLEGKIQSVIPSL